MSTVVPSLRTRGIVTRSLKLDNSPGKRAEKGFNVCFLPVVDGNDDISSLYGELSDELDELELKASQRRRLFPGPERPV